MSNASERYFDASTPYGLTTPAWVQASSATSTPVAIPSEWLGRFVQFTYKGNAAREQCCIRFGVDVSSATVALATASTNEGSTTYAITAAGTEPMLVLFDGQTIRERIDARFLFLCHIATNASGFLYASVKTGAIGAG